MFIKITMTMRTRNIILINNMRIKKQQNKMDQPDGTSLGRKAGNGPPSFIARVTVRASRIDWINCLCFSLQFAFDLLFDYSFEYVRMT